jgi:hypothetical protein
MLPRLVWLSLVLIFTIVGLTYTFDGLSQDMPEIVSLGLISFIPAAIFLGIDQITTAINSLKEDTNKLEE